MPVTTMIMEPRRWRSKRSKTILAISCHFLIACDVYHVFTSYLLRTTVVNKMIPYNNFKKVFTLTVHRCEGSLSWSTTWWSGVIDSNVRIQRVLTSLACTDMASEHKRPKGRTWVVWKIRSTWRCSPMMTSPSHVMIGHGLVDSDDVSLRWLEGCLIWVGVHWILWLNELNYHELSLKSLQHAL